MSLDGVYTSVHTARSIVEKIFDVQMLDKIINENGLGERVSSKFSGHDAVKKRR